MRKYFGLMCALLIAASCATPPPAPASAEPVATQITFLSESTSGDPVQFTIELPDVAPAPSPVPSSTAKVVKTKSLPANRTIFLRDTVNDDMAQMFINKVDEFTEKDAKAKIFVVIDSPGGSVNAGAKMIVKMKATDADFACYVDGSAFSMAAMIFEQCDQRYMQEYSAIMFHEMSFGGVEGPAFQVKKYVDHALKHWAVIQKDTADRLGLDLKEFQSRSREEWWMTAEEAVDNSAADGVVVALKYKEEQAPPSLEIFRFPF